MRIAVEANEQSEPGVVITDTRGRRYSIAEFRDAMRQGELR